MWSVRMWDKKLSLAHMAVRMEFWLKENRVIIEMLPMKGRCGMRKKNSGASHAVPAPLLISGCGWIPAQAWSGR